MTEKADPLEVAKQRLAKAKARVRFLENARARKESREERKARTRRLIVLGGLVEANITPEIASWILDRIASGNHRATDRAAIASIREAITGKFPSAKSGGG